jgi:hypothetical protein
MTSHSLRLIPVEGEYRLSINDLFMRRDIAPGALDKIHVASFFVELPLHLFDLILDVPGTSFNGSFLPSRLEHLVAFSTGLLPQTEASHTCITEVPSRGISSNLSISDHNSPMLRLESLHIATIILAPLGISPRKKWTNYKN